MPRTSASATRNPAWPPATQSPTGLQASPPCASGSSSALIPIVSEEWRLSASQAGLILGAFQLGNLIAYVVVGFLLDRMRTKPIMAWAAALVAMGDLLFALGARDFWSGIGLRLLVGVCLGGLYLPALKHIAETIPVPQPRGYSSGFW
ncbi:MAG: MFS transporter [candidate division NC10 bacterium]|nr:MFS transporter [candidate division NC10 bacterium]